LQARTNTLFRAVVYGVVPLGAVIGGLIAHVWSLQSAIVAAGVVEVLIVVVLARPILNRLSVTVDVRGPHEPAVVLPASGPGPSIGEALDRSRRGGKLRRIEDLAEDLDQTVAPLALK
jgi:hypothetical protein